MRQEDFDAFFEMLQVVGEQYGKKPSENLIALYWRGLQDYDFAAVRDAFGRHLRNTDAGQFMPKIADVIRMMQGSSLDSALSAWSKVDRAVRQVGTYETVVFDDPIIHRVLHDMGGWIGLSQKTEDEWPFVAKEFENRYRGFKARSEVAEYPAKLIGISEAHNSEKNKCVAPPRFVGDPVVAQGVFEKGVINKPLLLVSR